jgi:hypothetical protein
VVTDNEQKAGMRWQFVSKLDVLIVLEEAATYVVFTEPWNFYDPIHFRRIGSRTKREGAPDNRQFPIDGRIGRLGIAPG